MRDHTSSYLHVHSHGGKRQSQRHFSDWLAAHMWEELPVKQWTEWNFQGQRRLSLSICPDWFHSEYQSRVGHRRHKTVRRAVSLLTDKQVMSVSPRCVLSLHCYFISQMKAEKPVVPCSDIVRPALCSGTSAGKDFPAHVALIHPDLH